MNTTAIAQHLNVAAEAIVEIQEWARVLWVRVKGLGARFVSKKVAEVKTVEAVETTKNIKKQVSISLTTDEKMDLSREKLAAKIANELTCTARVWAKSGKVRVYLSHRGKDYGYVSVTNDGVEYALTGYANNTYGGEIRKAAEGVNIIPDHHEMEVGQRLSPDQADILARQKRDCRSGTAKALDAMYGRGGWDDRDREDYEG
jgi:hypothetical protein